MNCTKCNIELTQNNTTHGQGKEIKWCDNCHTKYWKKHRRTTEFNGFPRNF